jgi:hypothetical protein
LWHTVLGCGTQFARCGHSAGGMTAIMPLAGLFRQPARECRDAGRSDLWRCLLDGIISRQGPGEARCMIGFDRREPILWRDPNSGDASVCAVERGSLRILASADSNNTAPRSDAGRQAKQRASDGGCASRRTRATSADQSTWTECSAGAAIILGTGDGRALPHALRYKI